MEGTIFWIGVVLGIWMLEIFTPLNALACYKCSNVNCTHLDLEVCMPPMYHSCLNSYQKFHGEVTIEKGCAMDDFLGCDPGLFGFKCFCKEDRCNEDKPEYEDPLRLNHAELFSEERKLDQSLATPTIVASPALVSCALVFSLPLQ